MSHASSELAEHIAGLVARFLDARPAHPPTTSSVPVEYLTPAEAAGFIRLTPRALEHLRARGEGPRSLKVSGKVRYALRDLRTWIEQGAPQ